MQDSAERLPKLSEWEAEESQPTLRQLEEFAKKTLTPLGSLFHGDSADSTTGDFSSSAPRADTAEDDSHA